MKKSSYYATCHFARTVSAVGYACAIFANVELAWKADAILMKIIFAVLAILMLTLLGGTLGRIRELGRMRRTAEICEEFGEPVAADHGATIPEVMANIRHEEVEFVAFFTKDGRKLCESTIHCPTMTLLSEADQKLVLENPEGTMVHNHPGCGPVAFSPEDLVSLGAGVYNRAIVVTASASYVMEAPERACVPPSLMRWLGRKFYRGHSNSEASFNFCLAVADYFDWKFGMMLPVPTAMREATDGEMFIAVYDATMNGVLIQVCERLEK